MIPLFKSHYSIGKSILTLKEKSSSIKNGPQSIIDLCLKMKIEDLVNELVSKLGENIKISRFIRYQVGETQTDG